MSASPSSASDVPAIATARPSAFAGVIRSSATRKCANITANRGLVAMSTDPIAPEVWSKPMFIDAICTANSSATIHIARHSPFSGSNGMPRQRAHRAMQTIPIAKRRNAVVSGGKARRENLTATGFPPHSEWMTMETSTAPSGTDNAMPKPSRPRRRDRTEPGAGSRLRPRWSARSCPALRGASASASPARRVRAAMSPKPPAAAPLPRTTGTDVGATR